MLEKQASVEHTLPFIVKTLAGILLVPACVVLASLESYTLRAIGLNLDEIQYIALLSVLNFIPLALILLRFGGLEPRWFVSGAALSLAIIAGGYFLLQDLLPRIASLPSSPPSAGSGSVVVEARRPPPVSLPSLPAPPSPAAPTASAPPSSQTWPPPPSVQVQPEKRLGQANSQISQAPIQVPMGRPGGPLFPRVESPGPMASIRPFDADRRSAELSLPRAGAEVSAPPPAKAPRPLATAKSANGSPAAPSILPKDGVTLRPPAGGGASTGAPAPAEAPASVKVAKAGGGPPPAGAEAGPSSAGPPAGGPPSPPSVVVDAAKPSAPPEPDSAANTSAYWNTWFVGGTGPASNALIANNTYTYSLDLAAFNYAALRKNSQSSGVKVDRAFQEIIADLSLPEIILNIKPMIPEGSGLRLADTAASYSMKVDLRKIRQPNLDAAKQYADGLITIEELSKQVSAGSIQIPIFAESKGCATIAFAIFKGLLPLDHLVQRISIGADRKSAPVCDSDDPEQNNALSGGLDSLREVALGMEGSGASVTAAAALHIFDFATYSMAVFVDGRPGKNQSVYGWQTASSVVDYLKTDNFQSMVLKARKDSANNTPGSYIHAAQELAKVLFTTKPGNITESEAKNAEFAFRSVIKESDGPPVIVVRVASSVVDGQNRSIYVPIGILGAKGPSAFLDKPIIVVQPMALQRYPSRDSCIGDWTFAVPDGLENVPATIMSPGFFPTKYPGQRISDMDHLRQYLAAAAPVAAAGALPQAAASPSTVGLLVLAHQDEGFLWFAQSTDAIMPQDIERKFPAGSVGIFAACSAASAKGRNTALLQKLNEQGIDTLIASPFTIDAGYGVVFASSFAEVVEETTAKKERPTILKLFDQTISKTAQKFKDKTNGDYGELGLEYVLIGNPAITLCLP